MKSVKASKLIKQYREGKKDFKRANLRGARLSGGYNLSGVNLNDANLSGADLTSANLSQSIGFGSIFRNTTLTGATIEDWNINNLTDFDKVVCEYIFLKKNHKRRLPADGKFAPGKFFIVLQAIINEVEAVFQVKVNCNNLEIVEQDNLWEPGTNKKAKTTKSRAFFKQVVKPKLKEYVSKVVIRYD